MHGVSAARSVDEVSLQVIVYAGIDPLTGRRLYLRESTTDENEAPRTLTRLTARVDEQRHAKTNASFRVAMETWSHA